MKFIVYSGILILFSCSQKDQKMCDCLKAGEELNNFSAEILMKDVSKEDLSKMKKLKSNQLNKCNDYQTMSGEEMLKRKAGCEN